MGLLETLRAFFQREAADVKEGFENLRDKLDAELTKREREMEATPAERIDMIQDDMGQPESVFDRIEADLDRRAAEPESSEAAPDEPDASGPDAAADED